jgi:hypothetical protein
LHDFIQAVGRLSGNWEETLLSTPPKHQLIQCFSFFCDGQLFVHTVLSLIENVILSQADELMASASNRSSLTKMDEITQLKQLISQISFISRELQCIVIQPPTLMDHLNICRRLAITFRSYDCTLDTGKLGTYLRYNSIEGGNISMNIANLEMRNRLNSI